MKTVRILGTHGIPAAYGGFETAAQNVALYLAQAGWRVVVYCQEQGRGPIREDTWNGIERVTIPVPTEGWLGTARFDLRSIVHAARRSSDVWLTFGYNTAVFNIINRVLRIPLVINMDGIEWSRSRWGFFRQAILFINERIACFVGHALIADHPEIETYLRTRARDSKITTITYGAYEVTDAPAGIVRGYGLEPGRFLTLICRPIPENSLLELVEGFSAAERGVTLAVLGDLDPDADDYHRSVMAAAGDEVRFLGSIYEPEVVAALRYHSLAYMHGHTVGGTNPSLVEALGAGNPVIAHDNEYNRWTAGPDAAVYFTSAADVDHLVGEFLADADRRGKMAAASKVRFRSEFTWDHVAGQYEKLLHEWAS